MYYYNQNSVSYHLCFALMTKYAITENYKYLLPIYTFILAYRVLWIFN